VKLRRFWFSFEVSNEFMAESPVADRYVEACKARIAARKSAVGPRGGLYRLVTPPDRWRTSQDARDAFLRNVTVVATKRSGKYVRPDRITPDLRLGEAIHFDSLTTAAVDGRVRLPDGRTVETQSPFVAFPVLVS